MQRDVLVGEAVEETGNLQNAMMGTIQVNVLGEYTGVMRSLSRRTGAPLSVLIESGSCVVLPSDDVCVLNKRVWANLGSRHKFQSATAKLKLRKHSRQTSISYRNSAARTDWTFMVRFEGGEEAALPTFPFVLLDLLSEGPPLKPHWESIIKIEKNSLDKMLHLEWTTRPNVVIRNVIFQQLSQSRHCELPHAIPAIVKDMG
jgi:hypothetical protein